MSRFIGKRFLHQGLTESLGNEGRIRGEQAATGLEDRKERENPLPEYRSSVVTGGRGPR